MSVEGAERSYLPPARRGRRFGSYFVDMCIVAMASMIVFAAAGAPIFDYYGKADAVSSNYDALAAEAEKTHLLSEGEAVPTDEGAEKKAQEWINLQIDGTSDGDFLLYADAFYLGLSLEEHNARFLELQGLHPFAIGEDGAYGLSEEAKEACSSYLDEGQRDDETASFYEAALSGVVAVYQDIWVDIGRSETLPYRELYSAYAGADEEVRYAGGGAALVSYFLTAAIYYMALPFLFKRGRTISKMVLHLEVVDDGGNPPSVYQILSRGLIETLEGVYAVVFAPFFFLTYQSITLPAFTFLGSEFELWHVAIVGLLLTLVSGSLTFFKEGRSTLHDLSTFTRVVEKDDLEAWRLKNGYYD